MVFRHSVTARFFEIDRAGIVFFGRFFEYCHATFEELLARLYGNPEESFAAGRWAMPLVHAEADFQKPVRMGDRIDIALGVERLGERSVTFAYALTSADGAPHARVKMVHACIDLKTFKPRAVPDDLVAGLTRLGLLPAGEPQP